MTARLLNGTLNALAVCPAGEGGLALAVLTAVGLDDAVVGPRRSPALDSVVGCPADVGRKPAAVEVTFLAAERIPAVILSRRLARFQVAGLVPGSPVSDRPNRSVYSMGSWAFTEVNSGEHLCEWPGWGGATHGDQGEGRDSEVSGEHLTWSDLF